MATIHFVNLDPNIKYAVQNRQYSEEEIIRLNQKIKADEKAKKKAFTVTMILVTLLLLVSGIIIYGSEIGFPDALPLLLLNMLVAGIVAPVSWYAAIGRMSKQWSDLLRVYYHDVYMENEYGAIDQGSEKPEKQEQASKTKVPTDKKSVLKKAYYIITIILSVLVMALFVIVGISGFLSRHAASDMSGASASIVIAGIAAGSLILSAKGLLQNCSIPRIILEKAGILFMGIGLIVCITGLFSHSKVTEVLAISVPAFIIGVVCFIVGMKKKRK